MLGSGQQDSDGLAKVVKDGCKVSSEALHG